MKKIFVISIIVIIFSTMTISQEYYNQLRNIENDIEKTKQNIDDLSKEYRKINSYNKSESLLTDIRKEQIDLAGLTESYKKIKIEQIENILKEIVAFSDNLENKINLINNTVKIHGGQINTAYNQIKILKNQNQNQQIDIEKIYKKIKDYNIPDIDYRLTNLRKEHDDLYTQNITQKKVIKKVYNRLLEYKIPDIVNRLNNIELRLNTIEEKVNDLDLRYEKMQVTEKEKVMTEPQKITTVSVQHPAKKGGTLAPPVKKIKKPLVKKYICPNCGTVGKPGQKFCTKCGTKLVEDVSYLLADKDAAIKEAMASAVKYYNYNNYNKAIAEYNLILKLDKDNYEALFNKGLCLYLKGNHENSISVFKQLLSIYPEDKEAIIYLGLSYYNSGDKKSSKKVWRRLLEIDPENSIAKENLKILEQK